MPTVTIINGSQRSKSQSAKVVEFIRMLLERRGVVVKVLSLHEQPLTLWVDDADMQDAQARAWAPMAARLIGSDALVFVTPEWNGMAPPAWR
jgi:azobenzene reductase